MKNSSQHIPLLIESNQKLIAKKKVNTKTEEKSPLFISLQENHFKSHMTLQFGVILYKRLDYTKL